MKKTTFLTGLTLVLGLGLLTSCMNEGGYSYTFYMNRIATIHHTNPISMKADYTEEIFKADNVKTEADLAGLDLNKSDRAFVTFQVDGDDYKQKVSLLRAKSIIPQQVWHQVLPDSSTLKPLNSYQQLQYEPEWAYPIAWMSEGYLNVTPVIGSDKPGTYYLTPGEVLSGDTLRFDLHATYADSPNGQKLADYQCFDLRSLRDTAAAHSPYRDRMAAMLAALNSHQTDTTLVVMLVSEFKTKSHDGKRDSVAKAATFTNKFAYDFAR